MKIDADLTLFNMDDTTLSEVINVRDHISGTPIGRSLSNVKKVLDFANLQKMKLNLKKCKEMQLDFRINKTEVPSLTVDSITMEKVSTFKLLGVWIDDNLKWQTNTDRIIKKAVKRLLLLKTLKKYGASETDMKRFYASVIIPVLEYGAQVWHGGLTKSQSNNIERIQKRALRIVYSEKDYDKLLRMAGLKSLYERWCDMCIELIRQMSQADHKLHHLLPQKLCNIRQRENRLSG